MIQTCLICGAPIPEGRQVCPICDDETNKGNIRSGGKKMKKRFYLGYYIIPLMILILAQVLSLSGMTMVGISISAGCGLWLGFRLKRQLQNQYGFVEQLLFIRARKNKPTAIAWELIETINIRQSLFGKLFNYGDAELIYLYGDKKIMTLYGIKYPQQIRIEWFKQAAYKNYKGDVNYETGQNS